MKGNEQGCCKGWSCQGKWDIVPEPSTIPPLVRAHPMALDTDEAMSASSRVAHDADDAVSESSWTALAKGKERDWWSVDLEGEIEKLEVVGHLTRTEGGSVDPKGKMGHLVNSDKNYKRRK